MRGECDPGAKYALAYFAFNSLFEMPNTTEGLAPSIIYFQFSI